MRYIVVVMLVALVAACGGDKEPSDSAYINDLRDVMNDMSDASTKINGLLQQVQDRPALSTNDQWLSDMRAQATRLNTGLGDMKKLTPPDGELASAHASFLRAFECLSDGTNGLIDGYAVNNAGQVASASTLLINCADLWTDANAALQTAVPTD